MLSSKRLYSAILLFYCFAALADKQIHQHSALEIPADTPVPRIEIRVDRDPMDGLNVLVKVENYLLNSPLHEQQGSDLLQGHAHVFVNGQKKQRLYGNAIHIPQMWLQKGVNQIAISLNSHNHENWTKDGKSVVGSVYVDQSKAELVLHSFTSQPLEHGHH